MNAEIVPTAANQEVINRRNQLEGIIQAEMENAPGDFAVVAVDLDGLKDINDSEGHESGDAYKVAAREVLQAYIRHPDDLAQDTPTGDVIAEGRAVHAHGDEYWIVLRHMHDEAQVAEFIRRMQAILDDYGIGVSMGGRVHVPGEGISTLLGDADGLMYQNKMDRALAEHQLTPDQEAELRRHVGAIRALGIASLRGAQKLLTALDRRDEAPEDRRHTRPPIGNV